MTHQILLFYYYGHLPDAQTLVEQQRALCQRLGLTGRVLIGDEGINGTLEGETEQTEAYVQELLSDPRFATVHMKRSSGTGRAFPKLQVKYRAEIVSAHLGADDFNPADHTAPYITAEELHEWIHNRDDFVIVDMRNTYEHASGHFSGSVLPKMDAFRDLPKAVMELGHLKDKKVVTVCTGGVRCEKASGYLLQKEFKEVYQLHGGIVTYMEKYPNQDFLGKLYVFDNRVTMGFATDAPEHAVIGRCRHCDTPCELYVNDDDKPGRPHFICCEACRAQHPEYAPAGG
jgi:UPF0176 protein